MASLSGRSPLNVFHVRLCSLLCRLLLLLLLGVCPLSSGNDDKCRPFPRGEIEHNVTDGSVVTPGDVIQYEFCLDLNLSSSVSRVAINFTATSLKFCHNDSKQSVSWELKSTAGTVFDRNSSLVIHAENSHQGQGAHELVLKEIGGDNYTLQGTVCTELSDTAGAGDLVQHVLEVSLTHGDDNRTCRAFVHSPYFYLPPPQLWVSSGTVSPVPMMGSMDTTVNLRLRQDHPAEVSSMGSSRVQVRTPSEESSREVILTIQSVSANHMTGFTADSVEDIKSTKENYLSTYASFQYDVAEIAFPPLQRDDVNFSSSELSVRFTSRAEDYSQLSNDDVVNVSAAVTFGGDDVMVQAASSSASASAAGSGGGGGSGINLIWVSSMSVTLQAPPLDLKKPDLAVTIGQKSSCAYDGETRSEVDVKIEHSKNSTATAYNVTARVYLTDAMTLLRHVNSEIRQNSLSLEHLNNVVNVDIQRMTFSDPTTVTLDLDIDLTDPRARLAEYFVITADAVFSDRWGNSTGMFTDINYVSLKLDKLCSKRLNWTTSKTANCTCTHDPGRADCACCRQGACQCGALNPALCQPCDHRHSICQPYLHGFDAITQLDAGDGKTAFVCAAHHLYRAWSKGISCYRRTTKNGAYTWAAMNPIVGAILSHDRNSGLLYGLSNNGLAYMRSDDQGVTWFTVHPDHYKSQLALGNMENATLIYG